MARVNDSTRCPCGSGEVLAACCGRYLAGEAVAPTARALMCSRFTAFAVGGEDYLLATWHPSTRPAGVGLNPDQRWLHLAVEATAAGGPFDDRGTVEFTAVYRDASGRGRLHELSRFVREGGRWFYVDGDHD